MVVGPELARMVEEFQGNSLVSIEHPHCAQFRVISVQNVRAFPQTKLASEINSPFLLNEHGDPRFYFLVFAKNSVIKNISEEEKKFDSGTLLFLKKIVPNWVYFGQGEDFKLTTELSEKVQHFRNKAIKKSFNEAILLLSINEALLSR